MAVLEFKGFAGVRLEADCEGAADDPAVLMIHGGGQTRAVWADAAAALVDAGRRVINLDLRGHGGSEWPADGRYDFDAYVEDVRAVLAQLGSRPVIVSATLGGWIAMVALGNDAATLASGLVLVDLPTQASAEASREIGERLRQRAEDADGNPGWDTRLLDVFDVSDMPERLAQAAPKIALPVLFVRGGLSQLASPADAQAFVGTLPDVESAEVENANLLVSAERNDAFNALLLDFLERKQPRVAPEYHAGSDARTLRDALGCFATGVTIVTAVGKDGLPFGFTANSFTSVSLDPPLLLVCVAHSASNAEAIKAVDHFAVNVLQIGQQPTSNRFASKGEDRFANTPWSPGETGAPLLTGSLSAFECAREAIHDGGDHFILVGRVLKANFEPRRDPLLYFRGKYRRLHFA